jgi:hypothetical protein
MPGGGAIIFIWRSFFLEQFVATEAAGAAKKINCEDQSAGCWSRREIVKVSWYYFGTFSKRRCGLVELKEKFQSFIRKNYLWFNLLYFLKSNKWEQFSKLPARVT